MKWEWASIAKDVQKLRCHSVGDQRQRGEIANSCKKHEILHRTGRSWPHSEAGGRLVSISLQKCKKKVASIGRGKGMANFMKAVLHAMGEKAVRQRKQHFSADGNGVIWEYRAVALQTIGHDQSPDLYDPWRRMGKPMGFTAVCSFYHCPFHAQSLLKMQVLGQYWPDSDL